MTSEPSWYEVLGVPASASAEAIRSAHRTASKAAHPDAGGSAARFQLVQQAYEVLADPTRRAAYDRELRGEPAAAAPEDPGIPSRPAPAPDRPAPPAPPTPDALGGCLSPWVIVSAAVVVVVAVLVTIATLSSPSTTSSTGGSLSPAPRAPSSGAPSPGASSSGAVAADPAGAVTTLVLSDLPTGFPRGHVPLPTSARLSDVVVASASGAAPTFTIRASATGTDAERAALNYAASLQAAGWSSRPPTDADLPDGVQQRSFVDSDGATLQFVVGPAADGGLTYLIGFNARS